MEHTLKLTEARQALKQGIDIVLECKYWERRESHVFEAEYYGSNEREADFNHRVKCIKDDFKDISTFYGGNKSDCKFTFNTIL